MVALTLQDYVGTRNKQSGQYTVTSGITSLSLPAPTTNLQSSLSMQFDMSFLDPAVIITAATVYLYHDRSNGAAAARVGVDVYDGSKGLSAGLVTVACVPPACTSAVKVIH